MYNGYTTPITNAERLANLAAQIPQEYRAASLAACLNDDGNPHDFERRLTGFVLREEWISWAIEDEVRKDLAWLDGDYTDLKATEQDALGIGLQ